MCSGGVVLLGEVEKVAIPVILRYELLRRREFHDIIAAILPENSDNQSATSLSRSCWEVVLFLVEEYISARTTVISDVHTHIGMSKSTASRHIRYLKSLGVVSERVDINDHRRHLVRLNPLYLEKVDHYLVNCAEELKDLIKLYDKRERNSALDLLKVGRQELAEQTALLEATLNSIDHGFAVWDDQHRLAFWNDKCVDFWYQFDGIRSGMTKLDLLRHLATKGVFGPGNKDKLAEQEFQKIRAAGPDSEEEFTMQDGRQIFLRRYPMPNAGHAAVYTDVSERKLLEQGLSQAHESLKTKADEKISMLSLAIEQNPASVVITDTHGNIEYVNPAFEEISGYTSEEALNRNPRLLQSGEKPLEEYQELWKTIRAGQVWRGEFHNRRKDGSLYWEKSIISPVKDKGGKIIKFLAIMEDVTAHKEMEEALQEGDDRFRALFQQSPAGVAVEDYSMVKRVVEKLRFDGVRNLREYFLANKDVLHAAVSTIRTIDANEAFLKIHGASSLKSFLVYEANIERWWDTEGLAEFYAEEISALAEQGKKKSARMLVNTVAGVPVIVECEGQIMRGYEDTWSHVVTTYMDLTELRKSHDDLEMRIKARTQELTEEIRERLMVQAELLDRTELQQLLYTIASVANEVKDTDTAMAACLKEICDYTTWPIGHIYIVSPSDPEKLIPTDIWHLEDPQWFADFYDITMATECPKGVGLPGNVLASGEPQWIEDISKADDFPRARHGNNIVVKAGFAFPIKVRDEVVAVMEFFSPFDQKEDQSLLQSLTHIGTQIGRLHERAAAQKDLLSAKEKAETANMEKTTFLSSMSHELRTPLNAIIGFSSMINEKVFGSLENDNYEGYIKDIHNSGQHLLAVINDILDIATIEAGAVEIEKENFRLSDAVDASVSLISPRARGGRVGVVSLVDSKIPQIYADKRRVKQIFLNLLSNAVKFTPKGGKVTINARLNFDGSLGVCVTDTGVGMDEDEIVVALSKFGQADSGLDRKREGTGLGLPLTRELMELHGGTLEVESEKGHGTSITATFPKQCVGQCDL